MQPNARLNKDDCDKNPASDFHRRYRGIVCSLGYLGTMTRPELAWAYSELSKYVQNIQERTICLLLNTFCLSFAALGQFAALVILTKTPTFCGVG